MWKEINAERYYEMLGCLPPASLRAPLGAKNGFLVGEPVTTRICNTSGEVRAEYATFVELGEKHYEGPNMTMPEWAALTAEDIQKSML